MTRPLACLVAATLTLGQPAPALAYLKFGVPVGGQQVTLKWAQTPVRYFVSTASVPGVSSTDFQGAVARAFATWQAVPTASITYQFAGVTAASPGSDDGSSVLGFLSRPDLDRVLASTSFLVDSATGALIESDIFFNAAFPWSVAAAGESGRYDLQSIALHEIGHFSGLSHSALGVTELLSTGGRRVLSAEAVMFPIAFDAGSIAARTLKADDIAGISDLYPGGDFASEGSLSGSVTKDGQPIFGAHVVAFNPATGAMVGGFSLNAQGQFSIGGLSPGPHVVRVEPLDDVDISSFFDATQNVDIDFGVAFLDRVVVVPKGGDSGEVAVAVVSKLIQLGSRSFLLCAAAMLHVSPALAQSPAPRPFRFEAGIGVSWMGSEPIGARSATETTGAGGTSPLFNTSSELAGAAGFDGRIGVRLSRSLVAEAEASYLKPQLRIAISADAEGAAAVTASETIQQFTIGGNIRWMLPGRWWSPRLAPFALGGGGYLRQLHDQATLLETGRFYQLGAGVETLLASGRRFRTTGVGVRADLRAVIRSNGVAFDGGSKTSPAAGVSAFVRF